MKKFVSLLLVFLLLSTQFAFATDVNVTSKTQDVKLKQQLIGSGFKSNVTFSVEGNSFLHLDGSTFEKLKSFLSTLSVSLTSTPVSRKDTVLLSEILVDVVSNGASILDAKLLKDQKDTRYFSSSLTNDKDVFYAYKKGFDPLTLLTDFYKKDGWPSLLHVLFAIQNADKEFQVQADKVYAPYKTEIINFLQTYVETSSVKDEQGKLITSLTYTLPLQAVFQETKKLLVHFYSDTNALNLLKTVLSEDEQRAYLEPSMLLAFLQMLDNVKAEGNIHIERKFSFDGKILSEKMSLPFPDNAPLSSLSYVCYPKEKGLNDIELSCELKNEDDSTSALHFALNKLEEAVYTGDVRYTQKGKEQGVSFQLMYAPPVDTADAFNERWARTYDATLLIKPLKEDAFNPISFDLDAVIHSKSSAVSSITYIDSTCVVKDTVSDGKITCTLSGKTVRPWPLTLLEKAQQNAQFIDELDQEGRATFSMDILTFITKRLDELKALYGTSIVPLSTDGASATDTPAITETPAVTEAPKTTETPKTE